MKHIRNYHLRTERWRDVECFETRHCYQISTMGGFRRKLSNGTWKYIKGTKDRKGYIVVRLSNNYNDKCFKLHRLVGMTFPDLVGWTEDAKGKPFDEIQINHKDEFNKTNNCVWNLEWCTNEYNHNYGTRNKRQGETLSKTQTGMKYTKSRVKNMSIGQNPKNVLQFDLNGNFIREWNSLFEVEEVLGFRRQTIYGHLAGHQKTAFGYIWKYKN